VLYSGRARPLPGRASPSASSSITGAVAAAAPSDAAAGATAFGNGNGGSGGGARRREPLAAVASSSAAVITGAGSSSSYSSQEDPVLAALLAEKATLHKHLRAFEKEFRAAVGRKVATQGDILPVEREYRRYKEVKALIAQRTRGGTVA
jgi:hypothetical protein